MKKMETLENLIPRIIEDLVEACNNKIDPPGCILNIGEHVRDVKLALPKNYENINPEDAVLTFNLGGMKYYATPNLESIKDLVKREKIKEKSQWIGCGEKIDLECLSTDPTIAKGKTEYNVSVICEEKGGSAAHAAIAEVAFIRFLKYYLSQARINTKKKQKTLERLNRTEVIYLAIDPKQNGSSNYYAELGVKTLKISPQGYDKVPINLVFELGNKKTILRGSIPKYEVSDGSLYHEDIMENLSNISQVNVVAPKNLYLMELVLAIFNNKKVIRAGLFTKSSFESEKDVVRKLVSLCELLVENKEENAILTGKGNYDGLRAILKSGNAKEYIITRDKHGIIGAQCHSKQLITYANVQPYEKNIGKNPQFTGAGDVADGVINVCYNLGLDIRTTITLANLFASYRIRHGNIHEYARLIEAEIKKKKRASISQLKCPKAQPYSDFSPNGI
ncbi:hypothetical protein HYU07_05375 [Candidatus Woesearchaeota archaeon]|nr:hypothetical protein [Candidatus Woesearchaeota archaeon]